MWAYILIGVIVLLLVYVFITYNGLIKLSNRVKEAFATMDVYLKKRWDLIPNLVEAVKGYAKHERGALEDIVSLRSSVYNELSLSDKIDANEKLTAGISKIMALAESYPDLKAGQNFMDLSAQLAKIEDDIANSRKYFNAVVRNLNDKIQMFPSNIFAGWFGFKAMKMFEANAVERENIKVEL